MQVRDALLCCGRLSYGRGSGHGAIVPGGSGAVIGTRPGQLGDLREHSRLTRLSDPTGASRINHMGPVIVGASRARYQHHRGGTGSAAFEIYLAAATDVNQSGEVLASHSSSDYEVKWVNKSNKKQEDASTQQHGAPGG